MMMMMVMIAKMMMMNVALVCFMAREIQEPTANQAHKAYATTTRDDQRTTGSRGRSTSRAPAAATETRTGHTKGIPVETEAPNGRAKRYAPNNCKGPTSLRTLQRFEPKWFEPVMAKYCGFVWFCDGAY